MSIQDESFPNDELLDELEISINLGKKQPRFQFPNHHRSQHQQHQQKQQQQNHEEKPHTTNISSSSSSTDQNLSSESKNGRSPSALSSKTTASDPTGFEDDVIKKTNQKKSVSYQDIHSEYTKRRYKHVESKVGKYIASMKAEDEKRRKSLKFQRHCSMPETFSNVTIEALTFRQPHHHRHNHENDIRFRAAELHRKLDDCESGSDDDAEGEAEAEVDSSQNMTGPTSASSSGGGRHHESSDDASHGVDFIDKLAYAQLLDEKERIQSYSDYLQTKMDEKIGENVRLQRNVDFMRIELSNCKDKLKRLMSTGMYSGIGYGNGNGRHSLQALLYCATKSTKATQTEIVALPLPPPPPPPPQPPPQPVLTHDIYITPETLDANNNVYEKDEDAGSSKRECKNVATIHPISLNFSNFVEQENSGGCECSINGSDTVLRQRTNSNTDAIQRTQTQTSIHNSRRSYPSSNDSAIDVEPVELSSPKPSLLKLLSSPRRSHTQTHRPQSQREEFIYYDKHSGRYATLQTLNASSSVFDENAEAIVSASPDISPLQAGGHGKKISTKKHHSLRRRWLRLFGPCTRCNDHNQTLDNSVLHQTQIPLLEKSFGNHCRNIR